ncbi:MAG: ATP-dependent protease ATPase subunit HslU [Gemmatimonadales bacterium]
MTEPKPLPPSPNPDPMPWLEELAPRQIVAELDRYIVGQDAAKRAVAIAVRNRWRRAQAPDGIRDEITPYNIIFIGPTGVGKTEIARRLARLAGAPFLKVEASKFTEVGYVGRDVESMVRDLVDSAINMVRTEREDDVYDQAEQKAEERLLDLLLPPPPALTGPRPDPSTSPTGGTGGTGGAPAATPQVFVVGSGGEARAEPAESAEAARRKRSREKLREMLRKGELDDREVEVEVTPPPSFPMLDLLQQTPGMEGEQVNFTELLQEMMPKRKKRRTTRVPEARRLLIDEELRRMVDMDEVVNEALDRVENHGILFIDEIDKIAGERSQAGGPDVSREGVQRDLLPIVEGSTIQTRYGYVRTDHILFLAAGAFHVSKPSDLIPELQGRFPIRVELQPLTRDDFVRIMTEPENALTKQYTALVAAEGVELEFTPDAVEEVARMAWVANDRMENIGARRLHTVMATLMDDLLFDLPRQDARKVRMDGAAVRERLAKVLEDDDLRKYIL